MIKILKRFLIGKPLKNEELHGEKLNVFWGLPILSSDAISSVAYAGEEILWVLVPVIGLMAYKLTFLTALAIIGLLLILVFSYRQTIDKYPDGGGAYIVARDNLGDMPGLVAGSSLIIDYILTVAVSASAGTAAITSALPNLLYYKVEITIVMIILMTIGNLRGVKESARIFAIPTYLFIFSILSLMVVGFAKVYIYGYTPQAMYTMTKATGEATLFLMLRAFSAGCTALTGVEAVSNGIPNFAKPAQKNAKRVLALLAFLVLIIFGGTSYLATLYHAVPNHDVTVISQIATQVFGKTLPYYFLQAMTAILLFMAANTSFSGLPLLLSLIAKDGFAPRQFAMRGVRLGYSNGILMLSAAAGTLVLLFRGETHRLLPLYALGVFISFTLSQTGMFIRWIRKREKGWRYKALINGFGAVVTFLTALIIGFTKFHLGAWIVLVLIPILIAGMLITKRHYADLADQLRLTPDQVEKELSVIEVQKYVIVLVDSLNRKSLKAISYARNLANGANVVAFNVSIDREQAKRLKEKWKECKIDIPLIVKYSPYREVIDPLVSYIESEEHESHPGDMITVVMPQFVVKSGWEKVYHNQTANAIMRRLMQDRHIAVVNVPYVLD